MKIISILTPNGKIGIPLHLVAEQRANYYVCEVDGYEKYSPEWKEDVDWVMEDDYEGIDWLLNNSDFEDWKDNIIQIDNKKYHLNYNFWCTSEGMNIINYENN